MSNHPKPIRRGKPQASSANKRQNPGKAFIALAVFVVAAAVASWLWTSKHSATAPKAPPPVKAVGTNPPATVAAAKPDFQKLKGKWLRPDGGYVVDVRSVADDGAMDAAYFNPK